MDRLLQRRRPRRRSERSVSASRSSASTFRRPTRTPTRSRRAAGRDSDQRRRHRPSRAGVRRRSRRDRTLHPRIHGHEEESDELRTKNTTKTRNGTNRRKAEADETNLKLSGRLGAIRDEITQRRRAALRSGSHWTVAQTPGERRRRFDRPVRPGRRLAAELLRRRPPVSDRRPASGRRARIACYIFSRGCLPVLKPKAAVAAARQELRPGAQRVRLRPVAEGSGAPSALGSRRQRRRSQRQADRVVGTAQQAVRPAAPHPRQSVRPRAARLARRRWRARHLQVHARRQEAGADDRHADAVGQRRDALRPAHRHRVAARRHVLRERRLHQHARRQVRQERQVPHDVGPAAATRRTRRARAT